MKGEQKILWVSMDTVLCWSQLSSGHSKSLDTPYYDNINDHFDPHYPRNMLFLVAFFIRNDLEKNHQNEKENFVHIIQNVIFSPKLHYSANLTPFFLITVRDRENLLTYY